MIRPPHAIAGRRSTDSITNAVRIVVTADRPPPRTQTVAIANLLRRALLARLGRIRSTRRDSVLAGRYADGTPMTEHQHAHFLALARAGHIDELVTWAPAGFRDDELDAITSLTELAPPGRDPQPDVWPITLEPTAYGPTHATLYDLGGPSRTWTSHTPFATGRHPTSYPRQFLAAEVSRELRLRGLPTPIAVDTVDGCLRFVQDRPGHHTSNRPGSARPSSAMLRLTFAAPVPGPLSLGHLSHYGLGLFLPTRAH